MGDFKFRFRTYPEHFRPYRLGIQRLVLRSVIGRAHLPQPGDLEGDQLEEVKASRRFAAGDDTIRKAKVLVSNWRRRTQELADAGWNFLGKTMQDPDFVFQKIRNCCPTFVVCRPRTYTCNQHACPFCYSRRVAASFRAVDAAFGAARWTPADENEVDNRPWTPPLCLWTISYTPQVIPYPDFMGTACSEELSRYLRREMRLIHRPRKKMARALIDAGVLGILNRHVLAPLKDGWALRRRFLLATTARFELPESMAKYEPHIERIFQPSRKQIHFELAKICAYPRSYLFSNPAAMVAVLEAHREERLWSTTGVFRRRQNIGVA